VCGSSAMREERSGCEWLRCRVVNVCRFWKGGGMARLCQSRNFVPFLFIITFISQSKKARLEPCPMVSWPSSIPSCHTKASQTSNRHPNLSAKYLPPILETQLTMWVRAFEYMLHHSKRVLYEDVKIPNAIDWAKCLRPIRDDGSE